MKFSQKLIAFLRDELWVLILDALAVNAAYFLALIIRFYVNWQFRPVVMEIYLPAYEAFAPWYTIICLLVFSLFRLYNGIWRYAGLNDFNRILLANILTALIQFIGSSVFVTRMPMTYYVLGAVLQLFFVVLIRFGYRIYTEEKEAISSRKTPTINAVIVGKGEIGRQVIQQIQGNKAFRLVAIADDTDQNKLYDGVTVIPIDQVCSIAEKYNVKSIFIADSAINRKERETILTFCKKNQIAIQDYTGALSNVDDTVSLSSLLNLIKSKVVLRRSGEKTMYDNGYQAQQDVTERYTVDSIDCHDDTIEMDVRTNQQVVFVLNSDTEEAFVGYDAWSKRGK